jgi:hypothetical protein
MHELWKEVIKEAPEISWIDISSKDQWWQKTWAPGERHNPPKCLSWSKKLKKEGVDARIALYVKSKAPRHERLRTLLPLLQAVMTVHRTAANAKTNAPK